MFVWNIYDEIYRTESMDAIPNSCSKMDENTLTDEFGEGDKEFLCKAGGVCAPPVVALIHANSVDEANELRDNYFKQRILSRDLIFEQTYRVVKQ